MTTSTFKKELHKVIGNSLLKTVRKPLKPMTEKAFYFRNRKSQNDIKTGDVIAHKDVKKRFTSSN